MKSKYRKVLIIPYFGNFHDYFHLWLSSCSYNPDYDFLIYTDINVSQIKHPDNVKFMQCTLSDIRMKACRLLGFEVVLDRPYKLCDYRPIYGVLFYEDIKEYDFWGYCDIDLIFGNISKFLTDDIFDNYDKILTCGHFTLQRNTPKINLIFKNDPDEYYKHVYSTNNSCLFDEGLFTGSLHLYDEKKLKPLTKFDKKRNINEILYKNGLRIYINFDLYADINVYYDNLRLVWGSDIATKDHYYKHSIFYFDNGHVIRKYLLNGVIESREYMYIHLQKRYMTVNTQNITNFLILKHSFECFKTEIDKNILYRCNIDETKLDKKYINFKIFRFKCKIHYYFALFYHLTGIDIRRILTGKKTYIYKD